MGESRQQEGRGKSLNVFDTSVADKSANNKKKVGEPGPNVGELNVQLAGKHESRR